MTMLYALFGVPLMLMCLSSLGGLLAEALHCAYSRVCQRNLRRSDLQLLEGEVGVGGVGGEDKQALTNGCVVNKNHIQSGGEVSFN